MTRSRIFLSLLFLYLLIMLTPVFYILSKYDDCQRVGYEEAVMGDGFKIVCTRTEYMDLP